MSEKHKKGIMTLDYPTGDILSPMEALKAHLKRLRNKEKGGEKGK